MSASRAFEYWQAITPLEAKEVLLDLQIVKYPHLKKGARKKFERGLNRQSKIGENKRVLTTNEIYAQLRDNNG